jgi:ribonuclease HII
VVCISKAREKKLAEIGVRDSKLLTRRKREFLFEEINSLAEEVKTISIDAEEINRSMAAKISLNQLEALKFASIIDSLNGDVARVYLDSPDVIPYKFGIRISVFSKKLIKVKGVPSSRGKSPFITVIAEHKADSRYPVASSASIIAKVSRDREIERIKDRLGIDFGSGYPSDKVTIAAIRANMDNQKATSYIRNRWKTLQTIRQLKINEFF